MDDLKAIHKSGRSEEVTKRIKILKTTQFERPPEVGQYLRKEHKY